MINIHYANAVIDFFFHVVGYPQFQSEIDENRRIQFMNKLGELIEVCNRMDVLPVVIEQPIDSYFFNGNPWAEWQESQSRVVCQHGAVLIPLQREFDNSEQRLIFYEFIHPNRTGYKLIARRIYEQLCLHSERILNSLFP